MKKFWIMKVLKGIVFIALFVVAFAFVVMYLWNWLMPALFGVTHVLTFVEALGVIALSKLLFGGWGHRGGGHWRRHYWSHNKQWKQKWDDKLQHMSPEERERMKAMWEKRCRMWGYPATDEPKPTTGEGGEAKM